MIIFKSIDKLNRELYGVKNIGFVPTMGALHKGHINLITKSKKLCTKTIVSIFVNPNQFNNKADYIKYPRNINKDLKILKKTKVDYVLIPKYKQLYNSKKTKKFRIPKKYKVMCAKFRPGHFEGVLSVINEYLNKISLNYLFLGEKDFQQLFLIKNFVKNRFKTQVISCKTVRYKNKRPFSSRNNLLNKNELIIIDKISVLLKILKNKIQNNLSYKNNIDKIRMKLRTFKIKIEYFEIRNRTNLSKKYNKKNFKIFIAYYVNKVRIIDNF
tara:strand:- start:15605 stop:16414 length:810 start_codon:yes stop_codon:yes gene_type:complete